VVKEKSRKSYIIDIQRIAVKQTLKEAREKIHKSMREHIVENVHVTSYCGYQLQE